MVNSAWWGWEGQRQGPEEGLFLNLEMEEWVAVPHKEKNQKEQSLKEE